MGRLQTFSPTEMRLATATTTFDGTAGAGAVGTVDVFDVTGDILLYGLPIKCTVDLVNSVDGAILDIGFTDDVDIFHDGSGGPTDLDNIDAGMWLDGNAEAFVAGFAPFEAVQGQFNLPYVVSSANILYTITTQAITGGTLVAYALWSPLSADGNLVAS